MLDVELWMFLFLNCHVSRFIAATTRQPPDPKIRRGDSARAQMASAAGGVSTFHWAARIAAHGALPAADSFGVSFTQRAGPGDFLHLAQPAGDLHQAGEYLPASE